MRRASVNSQPALPVSRRPADVEGRGRGDRTLLRRGLLEHLVQRAAVSAQQREVATAAGAVHLRLSRQPILLVYPFIQRHFAKGMLLGAIKG